jgi:predicted ester cyclase
MLSRDTRLLRRLFDDVVNAGQIHLIDDLVTDQHILHGPDGDLYGPDGFRLAVTEYRTGFPDLWITTRSMVSAGDIIACRFILRGTHLGPFRGTPATGRQVEMSGTAIERIEHERLAESWFRVDGIDLDEPGATSAG